MKYTIQTINLSSKYLFFWGHRPNKDGSIGKSCFSQWWESVFTVDGQAYKTAEHYMMAQKAKLFGDHIMFQKIISCNSPGEAKKLGRKVKNFDGEIWEKHRFEIVKTANFYKFSQNSDLKTFLLNTNNRILVEASPLDPIWGIGLAADHANANNPQKWKGLNLLGFALMEVRDQLSNNEIN